MDTFIKSFSIDGVRQLVAESGIPRFRADQLLGWLYKTGVGSYDDMTNLPKSMRAQLAQSYPLHFPEIMQRQVSADGTRKYLLRLHDSVTTETVGLPSDDGRLTVCASSQAGCAMACAFCATGKNGLKRSLSPGEIVDQVSIVEKDFGTRVSNVVVMGQGEPFANFENVAAALDILNHPKLKGIGARHITVSTCGLIDGIERFSAIEEQFTLAISLHAARQDLRNQIMPKLSNQPLDKLRAGLQRYANKTGRRFTFEYALMDGVNDSTQDLDDLVSYCRGLLCHVNLIPLNEITGSPFKPVGKNVMSYWNDRLNGEGIAASIRKSRGGDIDAACGQLAARMNRSID